MKDVVGEVAELLTGEERDAEVLRQRLAAIRHRHAGLKLDLLAHPEPFDGSVSFDVLIRGRGPALSVGVAGSPALPWPLRAVVRNEDQTVVRVNGQVVSMAEAVAVLEDAWDDPAVLRRLVHAALVMQSLVDDPIEFSDEQIQQASHAFRRARGLYTADDTEQWLTDRGMTRRRFTELVARAARIAELRRRVTADRIEAWFRDHREAYGTLAVAWAVGVAPDALVTDPLGTVLAARTGGVVRWRVGAVPTGARALTTTALRESVEVQIDGRSAVAVVLERTEAEWDEQTAELVARDAFIDWLEERRARADVQWYWGHEARTGRATGAL